MNDACACCAVCHGCFFFFKQKTAYEIKECDWSSDVCSSDLSQETLFAFPEAKLGFITDVGGLQRLPRVVGKGHAREIAFRGHRFDAKRAHTIDLVNDVFPDKETLETRGREMA